MTVAITVAICVVVAEVVLRFLPVASSLYTVPVTAQSPVFHFTPNRDFVYSRDWDMVLAHRGHVNNAGFVNDQDYQKDGSLPMLAVVGDSMIEAAMVPYRDTLQGRLATALAGKLRVYSFATAGAPLSQYLIWARHAVREYGAQALVISVVGNDFDESHSAYKTSPGFWHYVPDANGGSSAVRVPSRAAARRCGSERACPLSAFQHASRPALDRAEVAAVRPAGDGGAVAYREQWVDLMRARLRGRATAAAGDLATQARRSGDRAAEVRWAAEACQLAPDDEQHLRALMCALRDTGNRVGALRAFQTFAQHVATEYDAEPANVSNSRATATGALSAMAQLSMR